VHKLFHRAAGRSRAIVLSAALLSGAALPAIGLGAGAASAAPTVIPTSTFVTSSHNPSFFGLPVTFTATVAPTSGVGVVAFKNGVITIPGCSARPLHFVAGAWRAFCTTSFLLPGPNAIRAFYSGGGAFSPSVGLRIQFVLRAPTHITPDIIFNFHQTFTVFGTLQSFFHRIPGQLLIFKTGHTFLCATHTNSHGVAACDLSYAKSAAIRLNDGRYQIFYPGSPGYRPSAAFGQAIILP
jgi:hypothetical protein